SVLTYLKRLAIVWGITMVAALVVFLLLWNTFFVYVRPGFHLVTLAKNGQELAPGQVLAEPGYKGIQREVKGEGWHFVMPIIYQTFVEPNTVIEPGKVGILTTRGGRPLPPGRVLADEDELGIQRHVLPPGAYRRTRHGIDVEQVEATEIKPGFVGVLRRRLGRDGKDRYAEDKDEKGILRLVLQPGLYYLNTKEFEVIKSEVGIFQTTFRREGRKTPGPAITFTSKGGFNISMDCTVEWEVLPENVPALVAEYGSRKAVEKNVIDLQARAIGRDKGIDYGAQDLLEGTRREKFQEDFTKELVRVCKAKGVTIHSAFIRNIDIPEQYLKPIRDKQ